MLVMLMALGGGMILNLMPCVFPVLAMKAMTFVQSAGHEKIENIRHSWAYTIGVVVSFLIVGGALLVLKWVGGVDVDYLILQEEQDDVEDQHHADAEADETREVGLGHRRVVFAN